MMRTRFDMRYEGIARRMSTYKAVAAIGYEIGKWGGKQSRCKTAKGYHLWYAWMDGYVRGWNEFRPLRDKPKPPTRPGPNGGRRIRLTA